MNEINIQDCSIGCVLQDFPVTCLWKIKLKIFLAVLVYCSKVVFVTCMKWDKQGNRSLLLVPIHQPSCVNVCISFFVCFWERLYITATEIRQVQSCCIIYINTFIIIIHIHNHNHIYRYRKPLQPMPRTPITTGALSLTCIYIALQKVPNLFSFCCTQPVDIISHCSVTPPAPPKKAWLPTFLSCLKNICVSPWQEADSVPHH